MLLVAQAELERKKREWVGWAESEYLKCKNARTPFEQQWHLNLAFNAGKHYLTPINVAGSMRLTTPKAPPWRVRAVINKIRNAVITECSKLTTSKPIPTVRPATNEDEDFSAAAVGEQLIKAEFATSEFEAEYRSWIWWGVVCGTSFLKQYYDKDCVDMDSKSLPPRPTFGNGTPIPDEVISSIPGLKEKLETPIPAKGKIKIERVTPFHIYVPDLLAEKIDEQPYVIHAMVKTPEWVMARYGFTPTPDARASNTLLESATLITKGSEAVNDSVMVKEVWIKPQGHKDFPEGGLLTIINNKLVAHQTKWPYPFAEFPFYKYNGLPTGGFYNDSRVVDLIPVQKEYNKKRSQALEIMNTMGKPKLLYARGSINPRMISSEPGQSIPYQPGYDAPVQLQGTEVPNSFINEIEQLSQEFDDISGQHEISRGQTSLSSLTSGTAIAYLQEQDDAKLNYQVASIESACEIMGKHYLHLAGHFWDEDRVIRTAGRNNTYEAIRWRKGILKGNTDVQIQTGSALPFSKAASTALITEMMTNGFIDPESGMEMMDMGNMNKILDDAFVDKRQAYRENLKMADLPDQLLGLLLKPAPGPNGEPGFTDPMTGQEFNGDGTPFQPQPPIPVNSWDNHEAHVRWHNHFRKSQEFELLSEDKKKAFELHVQTHQIALSAQMQNQYGMNLDGGNEEPPVEEQEMGTSGQFQEQGPETGF